MRTIVAGSRTITSYSVVEQAIKDCPWVISTIISGHARGPDKLGELYAKVHQIPLEVFPADWDTYGRRAGPIRNEYMANNAEALIAIWDGKSRGTLHMIDCARERGLRVLVITVNVKEAIDG